MLTPRNRVYVDDYGITRYAPAYAGLRSCIADVVTFLIVAFIVFRVVKIYKKRRR